MKKHLLLLCLITSPLISSAQHTIAPPAGYLWQGIYKTNLVPVDTPKSEIEKLDRIELLAMMKATLKPCPEHGELSAILKKEIGQSIELTKDYSLADRIAKASEEFLADSLEKAKLESPKKFKNYCGDLTDFIENQLDSRLAEITDTLKHNPSILRETRFEKMLKRLKSFLS